MAHIVHIQRFEEFQTVMRSGALAFSPHFALHALAHSPAILRPVCPSGSLRLGALLPKRFAKRAVTRNLLRRQIYAISAQTLPPLGAALQNREASAHHYHDFVVRLRSVISTQDFPSASSTALKNAMHAELQNLFAAGLKKLASGNTSRSNLSAPSSHTA